MRLKVTLPSSRALAGGESSGSGVQKDFHLGMGAGVTSPKDKQEFCNPAHEIWGRDGAHSKAEK